MAKRFNLPFHSLDFGNPGANEEWEVELWDSAHVGAATEVTGTPEGLRIEWEGTNDPTGALMPSSATYAILIEDAGDMALVTAIAGAAEGRFKLVVRRAGSANVYWAGWVHADDSSYPDNYYPFHFEIYATDGIARLKDVDYMDPDGVTFFTGEQTIIQHLVRIIDKIGTHDVGTWPAARIRSTANWYANGMNTTTCPLNQALVRHDRFEQNDREGSPTPWSYFAVLDALLRFQHCQLLHEGGMYHVRQIDSYADATQKAHYYDAAGAWLSSANEDMDVDVDYATATGMRKVAGGRYTWLPPLKEVCTDYRHRTSDNLAQGLAWSYASYPWRPIPVEVYVDAPTTTQLRGRIRIKHRSTIGVVPPGTAVWPMHRFIFFVGIRIRYAASWLYLERNTSGQFFEIEPDELAWGGDENVFRVWTDTVEQAENGLDLFTELEFTTPFIDPAAVDANGAEMEMRLHLDRVVKLDGSTLSLGGGSPYQGSTPWQSTEAFLQIIGQGHGDNPDNETLRTCAEATGGNTEKRYIDTYLGDGPATFSASALHVGTTATELWKVGNLGTGLPVAELLAKQVLRFRKLPQWVFQVEFLHRAITPLDRFVDDDVAWMATRITLSAFENRWGGEFVRMLGDVDGISSSEPHTPSGPMPPHQPPNYPGPPQPPPPDNDEGFTGGGIGFSGIIGSGTVPGYVAHSESAPATLTADLLASTYNSAHSLTVSAVAFSWAKKGDQLTLINPVTGHRETFTVATSYVPGATTIAMKTTGETMVKDFPYGSFVKLTKADEIRVKGWSYYDRNVTGTGATNKFWAVPLASGTLPDPTLTDAATIRERVRVVMGGTVLLYNANPFDDAFGIKPSTNEIEVYIGIPGGMTMFVEVR